MAAIPLDRDPDNADWVKRSWSLPPYKCEEFMRYLRAACMTLDGFRKLPVYAYAVARGRIVNDEWVEDD